MYNCTVRSTHRSDENRVQNKSICLGSITVIKTTHELFYDITMHGNFFLIITYNI